MLTIDTSIQCLISGACCPVQELEAGSLVFNPVTGEHVCVVEMLSRLVSPGGHPSSAETLQILPMRVPAGRLGQNVPTQDLIVSAGQRFLHYVPNEGANELVERSANSMAVENLAVIDRPRTVLPFTLYLLLFEKPTVFIANGAYLLGLSLAEVFTSSGARAVSRPLGVDLAARRFGR